MEIIREWFDFIQRGFPWSRKREAITEEDLKKLEPYKQRHNIPDAIKRLTEESQMKGGNFRFAVFGDTRGDYRVARDIILSIAEKKPSFVLMTGDIVRRGRVEEYLAHHLRMAELIYPIPVIPVPGNHEEGPDRKYTAFLKIYQCDRFCFDFGPARFIGFNNNLFGSFTREQLDFLEQHLKTDGVKYRYVVMHKPPEDLPVFVKTEEGRGVHRNTRKFYKVMRENNVTEVFMGHVHGFVTKTIDGVRYTITAGGGARLENRLSTEHQIHHYLLYEVTPEKIHCERMEWKEGEWQRVSVKYM
ncbi:MAG TPA: metallophosphoesterase [Candidatus Hydrogenedens sp.]|nr:metallophosphoesterase [Candidatus Hydrogenedens sp.]